MKKNNRGFSLLEVLFGLFLLVLIALCLLPALASQLAMNQRIERQKDAYFDIANNIVVVKSNIAAGRNLQEGIHLHDGRHMEVVQKEEAGKTVWKILFYDEEGFMREFYIPAP